MNVFLTGVSTGLGRGIAEAALAAGADVYGCSRRAPEGLELNFRSLDLSLETEALQLREWLQAVPRFDCVVLNAGQLPPMADMSETSLETLRAVMEVNLWANKWILDVLFEGGRTIGQVVAISSGAAVSGHRGWAGYGISKAALNMLIQLYAAEQPATHFTALAPGLIDTAMQDALFATPSDPRFPTLERLKAAKGTEAMPSPSQAGKSCWEAFKRLRQVPSGAFVDIRNLTSED